MITFLPPLQENSYTRNFAAEIDVLETNELLLQGTMQDYRFALQHTWKLRTPAYEIVAASAQQHAGDPKKFMPELCERYENITGVKIGRGFTQQVLQALGDLPGTQEHLFLALEMARSGQQVYQFSDEFEAAFAALPLAPVSAAHTAWLKDRAYAVEIKNSCHTYNDANDALFAERQIRCSFDPALTHAQPGDKRVFWRNKRLTITKNIDESFTCESAMQDRVHDILIGFTLDKNGVISNANSRGLRLPYHGLCEDPHQRTANLNGLQLTENYAKEFAMHIGGASGCTHLYDLSIDCLRLFKLA